jgi:hypothetical protein
MDGDSSRRIEELERRIADLKARLPRHSVPASMLMELDDLEEELEHLQAGRAKQEE